MKKREARNLTTRKMLLFKKRKIFVLSCFMSRKAVLNWIHKLLHFGMKEYKKCSRQMAYSDQCIIWDVWCYLFIWLEFYAVLKNFSLICIEIVTRFYRNDCYCHFSANAQDHKGKDEVRQRKPWSNLCVAISPDVSLSTGCLANLQFPLKATVCVCVRERV